jgi:hypothetical protein
MRPSRPWPRPGWPVWKWTNPDHDEAERARLRALAADLGLVTTGGSDDYGDLTGHRLGVETASPAAFEQLMALPTGSAGG